MFKNIFSRGNEAPSPDKDEAQLRSALAALMVEAARADEHYDESEKAIIDKLLASTFSITGEEAEALRGAGEALQRGALDIQRFTRHAKEMSTADKSTFIEGLWEIVLSDGERDPFEDTLIRRICGLIYLDDRDSGVARARAQAKLGQS